MTFQVDGARSVGNAGGGTKPIIARGTSDRCPTFKVSHPKLQGDYRVKGRTLQVLDKKGVYQNASPQQRANLQNLRRTDVAFKNALAGPGNTALSDALDGGVGEKSTAYAPSSASSSSPSAAAARAAAAARNARDF
jgi:hypothetical protein